MGLFQIQSVFGSHTAKKATQQWPHRRQPTRLPRPWDSPGKNTGVGCHFLLQCMKVRSEGEITQSCATLSDPMDCRPPGSSIHGIFQARVLEWGAIAFSVSGLVGVNKKLLTKRLYNPVEGWKTCVVSQSYSILCDPMESYPIFCDPMEEPTRLLCPWDFTGKNTGVGCNFLLQGIFPTHKSNLLLWGRARPLHCKRILYRWAIGAGVVVAGGC